MEILNNHRLTTRNPKVFFHYSHKEYFLSNEQRSPLRFNSYSISGNNLILTHDKYFDFRLDAMDSLRDWKLLNVDRKDCNPEKLDRLVKDRDIVEIKIVGIKNGKKLIFYSKPEVYVFKCEDIEQEIRGHSRKEIADMLHEKEEYVNEIEIQNTKLYEFIARLSRFVNGESRDHRNLLALNQNKDISLATKSEHYLEILSRVKDKMEDLKKTLPEYMLKYHGILR
jgi:hypothetical protein